MFTLSHSKPEIPTIETGRLLLRGHRLEDLSAISDLWAGAMVTSHRLARLESDEEVWSRLLHRAGHWALMGYGYWVAVDRKTGTLIGEAGFADFRRDIVPSMADMPEVGWALSASAQADGLGMEAVRTIVAWGEAHFGQTPTLCMVAPDNLPSLRMAAACGYDEIARTTYKDEPAIILRRHPGTGGPAVIASTV